MINNLNNNTSTTNLIKKEMIALLRPKQWSKNLLLFAALIFSYSFIEPVLVLYTCLGFISFSFLSSSAYIVNDIIDRNEDRLHPKKRNRPLASGTLDLKQAVSILIPLFIISLALAWFINSLFFLISLSYFLLTTSYSIWLKHIVIMDIFAIALGFLLRAVAGAFTIMVNISSWFLFCVLLLSLFLALAKRRQEILSLAENYKNHRRVLEHYPLPYIDHLISIMTASAIIAYSLYTFTASQSELFMLTIPFVIFGIFRYLYLIYKQNLGESPEEMLLKDKPLLINILLWLIFSIAILTLDKISLL